MTDSGTKHGSEAASHLECTANSQKPVGKLKDTRPFQLVSRGAGRLQSRSRSRRRRGYTIQVFKLFISSPGDATAERLIIEQTVSRLNGSFAGKARIDTIRWETEFYKADRTFQAQIPEASACDIVISVFRGRLGQPIPTRFAALPDGEAYPSGTAYEVLTAIETAKQKSLPDVYVFRRNRAPAPALNAPDRAAIENEWRRLSGFFERWFVNAGEGFKAAFQGYDEADDFAQQVDALLREWLARRVLAGRSVRWPVDLLGSPFRGLASFGARHSSVFFGRDRESEKAVALITDAVRRGVGFLLVSGLSGAGKSSLARAGIVPRLTTPGVVPEVDLWRVASLRPGATPLATLAAKLFERVSDIPADEQGRAEALPELEDGDYKTPADLAELFQAPGPAAVRPVMAALDRIAEAERMRHGFASPPQTRMVVMVDQLDDLFATSIKEAERERFAALLGALARSGRAVVVATLRADLLASFLAVDTLRALREEGAEITLAPPGPAELADIVRAPAAAAGLTFEEKDGERLDERLLREVDKPDMLPLLQLALDKLFAGRTSVGGQLVLPFAAYGAGLSSLIETEAEAALRLAGPQAGAALKAMLRPLLERDRGGKPLLRTVPRAEAARDETRRVLLDALIDQRIMLSDQDGVRIAHQRVLSDWPAAAAAVASNAEFYRIRDEVSAAHRIYLAEGERKDRLLGSGKPVADAVALVKDFGDEVEKDVGAYIAASQAKARLGARLKNGAIAGLVLLTAAAGGGGLYALQQRDEAVKAQELAEKRRKEAEANFDLAKGTINSVIFDFAQGFKQLESVRPDVLQKALATARKSLDSLTSAVPEDRSLQRLRAAALNEFGDVVARADTKSAIEIYEESLAIFRVLAIAEPGNRGAQRDLWASMLDLATLTQPSAPDTAIKLFEEGLVIARKLVESEPDSIEFRSDLAHSLTSIAHAVHSTNPLAAAKFAEEAMLITRSVSARVPNDVQFRNALAESLNSFADIILDSDAAKSLELYNESLTISRALSAAEPSNWARLRTVSITLERIGHVTRRTESTVSLKAFEERLAIARKLSAAEPANRQFREDVKTAIDDVATMLERSDPSGALNLYQEGLTVIRALNREEPENQRFMRGMLFIFDKIATLTRNSNPTLAINIIEQGIDSIQKLISIDPANQLYKMDLSSILERLADIVQHTNPSAAFSRFYESLLIRRALLATDPRNIRFKSGVAGSLFNFA